MSYRILIRRAESDLASIFLGVMEDYPFVLLTPSSESLDWTDATAVEGYFNEKSPSLVIQFPQTCNTANEEDVAAACALAAACTVKSVPLIQLSSFRVFGEAYIDGGMDEFVEPAPADPEGQCLLQMELAAQQCPVALVLRLPWMMDVVEGCLFDQLMPQLLENQLAPVSDHHRFSLVSTGFVIRTLIALTHQVFCGAENWGVFHLRSSDFSSEAEFVDATIRMLHSEAELELDMPRVISGKEEGRLLSGSANLNGRRCTDDFGVQYPSWRHGFKSHVRRWLHDHKLVPDLRKVAR